MSDVSLLKAVHIHSAVFTHQLIRRSLVLEMGGAIIGFTFTYANKSVKDVVTTSTSGKEEEGK